MKNATAPIKMLKEDHKKVKELFKEFEDADDFGDKKEIALEAVSDLKIHDKLESEIFYPAIQSKIDDDEIMAEAQEEHHVVRQLIAELEEEELDETAFTAKFTVLAENVRHHIQEEEGEMFPEAEKTGIDMDGVAERMMRRKTELEEGIGTNEPSLF